MEKTLHNTQDNQSAHEKDTARRDFIRTAGLAVAGIGVGTITSAPAFAAHKKHKGNDVDILQVALGLEHEGIAAYQIAGGTGLLSADVLKVALNFLGHHKGHRDALAKLIMQAGGKPVEPKTDAQYIAELNLSALKSQADIVALAAKLELGATNAYVGQVAALKDHQLARLFAQLSTDEAVHWTVLNSALGNAVPTNAFLFG